MQPIKQLNNKHYYLEGERIVFTASFHLERGFCCGNGCKHCPFNPKHIKGTKEIDKKDDE